MEYLQYYERAIWKVNTKDSGFKPCYKWNTFNTQKTKKELNSCIFVLNLVINGIPSILMDKLAKPGGEVSFKPCYKWNTFNTS